MSEKSRENSENLYRMLKQETDVTISNNCDKIKELETKI